MPGDVARFCAVNNPTLKTFSVGQEPGVGTLQPPFDPSFSRYTIAMKPTVNCISFTGITTALGARALIVTVLNSTSNLSSPLWPPQSSGCNVDIAPNYRNETRFVVVTAPDGKTTFSYVVDIVRPPEPGAADASLKTLNVTWNIKPPCTTRCVLKPPFDPAVFHYTIAVNQGENCLRFTGTVNTTGATAVVVAKTVTKPLWPPTTAGCNIDVTPNYHNETKSVVVTARDGTTKKTYVVDIRRPQKPGPPAPPPPPKPPPPPQLYRCVADKCTPVVAPRPGVNLAACKRDCGPPTARTIASTKTDDETTTATTTCVLSLTVHRQRMFGSCLANQFSEPVPGCAIVLSRTHLKSDDHAEPPAWRVPGLAHPRAPDCFADAPNSTCRSDPNQFQDIAHASHSSVFEGGAAWRYNFACNIHLINDTCPGPPRWVSALFHRKYHSMRFCFQACRKLDRNIG
jgi:hypothetical protein